MTLGTTSPYNETRSIFQYQFLFAEKVQQTQQELAIMCLVKVIEICKD